jgi:hypothetical protein
VAEGSFFILILKPTECKLTLLYHGGIDMRSTICVILSLAVIWPAATSAQSWSKEEQGLLDHIKMCWDAWMEAVDKNDPDIWLNKCGPAENASMWWTTEGVPNSPDTIKKDWESIRKWNLNLYWVDIRPVAIRIFDNVGMAQFYGYWKVNSENGPITTEYKRTEVFTKSTDGGCSSAGRVHPPIR